MKLQTQIPLGKAHNQIDYSSLLVLLGSCFSENIGAKLKYFQFQTLQNPFGILFHPLAIENLIQRAVQKRWYAEEDVFLLNERWQCFDAHSDLSDTSVEKLLNKLNSALESTRTQLLKTTHVLITLGTAWVYRHKETERVVANCHKVPQVAFEKYILSIKEITDSLERLVQQIQSINTNAQIVFTVSPVRHLKDGFVENQQSKSHLISAIQTIDSQAPAKGLSYFESYELMMDELRDYRFYKTDMVHPNELAIEYIWEKFQEVWIADTAKVTLKKIDEIQKGLNHKPFHSESEQHLKFKKSLEEKISYIRKAYPFMEFNL